VSVILIGPFVGTVPIPWRRSAICGISGGASRGISGTCPDRRTHPRRHLALPQHLSLLCRVRSNTHRSHGLWLISDNACARRNHNRASGFRSRSYSCAIVGTSPRLMGHPARHARRSPRHSGLGGQRLRRVRARSCHPPSARPPTRHGSCELSQRGACCPRRFPHQTLISAWRVRRRRPPSSRIRNPPGAWCVTLTSVDDRGGKCMRVRAARTGMHDNSTRT